MARSEPNGAEGRAATETSIAELLGGVRGVVESTVPGVVFAIAFSVNGQRLTPALWSAVIAGAVVMVVALLQRRPLRQALGGFIGVGVMALVARFTGRAEDFYLPSVLKNIGYAVAYLVSIAVRWPLLGVLLGPVLGEGFAWRRDPARRRAYSVASWFWVGMFGIRVAVQVPLYLAGAVAALGFMSVPLGLPLFALTCWLSYLVLRQVPTTRLAATEDRDSDEPEARAVERDVNAREG